jgi:archaetidylinositol phosphate synthase
MACTTLRPTAGHIRENTSVLAPVEKRALLWLARRLPPGIHADHLSLLGLTAMGGAGLSCAAMALTPWAVGGVVVSLALNWFGDSLDGTVARVRGHERPRYGYYVDHVIDLAGATLLLVGLACSTLMAPLTAALVLAAYLLVSAETYLATHARGVFQMSFLGVGPTELRILIVIGMLRAAYEPWVSLGAFGPVRLFDVGGLTAAVSLVVVFVLSAVRTTRALYLAEPIPTRSREAA